MLIANDTDRWDFEKSEKFIKDNLQQGDEDVIYSQAEYLKVTEDFAREFKDKLEIELFCICAELSEDFLREFKDEFDCVDWINISYLQELSEDFIREFQDKVNWTGITMCQDISEDFIREFQDKIDWDAMPVDKLSYELLDEFEDKFDLG